MKNFHVVVLLSVLLLSCSKQTIEPEVISESIKITYQDTGPIAGNPVDALLTNTSKYCIKFDLLNGVKLFAKQKEKWVEIPNLVEFIGTSTITLMPEGNLSSEASVIIGPDTTTLIITTPIDAYALLTGHLCDDETIQIQKKIPFTIDP
jgi:hypothetical protein